MYFTHVTPIQSNGKRLFYRSDYQPQKGTVGGHYVGPLYLPPRENSEKGLFRLLNIENVIVQLRLYRWFWNHYKCFEERGEKVFGNCINKKLLMREWFPDHPEISTIRVGRVLRMLVQYETNFQVNKSRTKKETEMKWRWSHPLEFVYSLEHLMALWLPRVIKADGGSCDTHEEYLEELEVLKNQTMEEDNLLVEVILRNRLY